MPILGKICAGDGIEALNNFEGYFFVDNSIRADLCLIVHGDSMIDAGIYNGDIAFLKKDTQYFSGRIYAVCRKWEDEAMLKKVFWQNNGTIILNPCNPKYSPIIETEDNTLIIGELVGVYHATK